MFMGEAKVCQDHFEVVTTLTTSKQDVFRSQFPFNQHPGPPPQKKKRKKECVFSPPVLTKPYKHQGYLPLPPLGPGVYVEPDTNR